MTTKRADYDVWTDMCLNRYTSECGYQAEDIFDDCYSDCELSECGCRLGENIMMHNFKLSEPKPYHTLKSYNDMDLSSYTETVHVKYPQWKSYNESMKPARPIGEVVEERMLGLRISLYMEGLGYTDNEVQDEVNRQVDELRAKRVNAPEPPKTRHRGRDDFLRDIFA